MFSLERTFIEVAKIEADPHKSSKERRSVVDLAAKAEGPMAPVIIEAEEQALIIDEDELQVC